MHSELRHRRSALLAMFYAYALLMIAVSVAPQGSDPGIAGLDKALHLLAYAVFSLLGCAAFPRSLWRRLGLGLFAFGLAMEGLQGLLPTRYLSLADQLANTLGILLGFYIAMLRTRPTHRELAQRKPPLSGR